MKEIATRAVRPDQPKPPTRDCACLSVGRGGRAAKCFTNASRLRRRELRYRLGFGRGHKITWAYPITPVPILRKSLQGISRPRPPESASRRIWDPQQAAILARYFADCFNRHGMVMARKRGLKTMRPRDTLERWS